jgi:hypothetical protein
MAAIPLGGKWIFPFCASGIGLGLGMDYYGTFHYKSFDPMMTKCYQIDARAISKPGVVVGSAMSEAAGGYTAFCPRNGDIVRARPVPDSEHWCQLLGGSYVQRHHCGVTVMREVPCPADMGEVNMVRNQPLPPFDEAFATPSPAPLDKTRCFLVSTTTIRPRMREKFFFFAV